MDVLLDLYPVRGTSAWWILQWPALALRWCLQTLKRVKALLCKVLQKYFAVTHWGLWQKWHSLMLLKPSLLPSDQRWPSQITGGGVKLHSKWSLELMFNYCWREEKCYNGPILMTAVLPLKLLMLMGMLVWLRNFCGRGLPEWVPWSLNSLLCKKARKKSSLVPFSSNYWYNSKRKRDMVSCFVATLCFEFWSPN